MVRWRRLRCSAPICTSYPEGEVRGANVLWLQRTDQCQGLQPTTTKIYPVCQVSAYGRYFVPMSLIRRMGSTRWCSKFHIQSHLLLDVEAVTCHGYRLAISAISTEWYSVHPSSQPGDDRANRELHSHCPSPGSHEAALGQCSLPSKLPRFHASRPAKSFFDLFPKTAK